MPWNPFCSVLLFVVFHSSFFISCFAADDKSTLRKLLEHKILKPGELQEQVELFTESRTPQMPDAPTLDEWKSQAVQMRRDVLDKVVFRGGAARWREFPAKVEWLETVPGGPGYHIRKLRYEVVPGMWAPALLYEPDELNGKVPVVLNVNGHDSKNGKAAPYKQLRCINQAKRGMIALNVEWLGMGQLNGKGFQHARMNQLDLCGVSGLAPYYLAMSRALDILLAHPNSDPERVGVAGLSGGGWQTIFISSLDTRVKLCNPVAGYSSFRTRARHHSDLGDSEQTPNDLATVADYKQLTAMLAPRSALLTFNIKDNCCFASDHALPPLLEAAEPIYRLYGQKDRLRSHVNHDPGTHNFDQDNRQAFYRIIGDSFFPDDSGFDSMEIDSSEEVKSFEYLSVRLPEKNEDFHSLALAAMKNLPVKRAGELSETWMQARRQKLGEIVHSTSYKISADQISSEDAGGVHAVYWSIKMGTEWTVPVVELSRGKSTGTTILVADEGRAALAVRAEALLANGQRVLAIDPFYFGESKLEKRAYLFALLVAAVGERPIGIQASQIAALARWASETGKVNIVAEGPRSSVIVLTAAALEPEHFRGLELHGALGSLKEVIQERDWIVSQTPELFCFGLLEEFDLPQLIVLAGGPGKVIAHP